MQDTLQQRLDFVGLGEGVEDRLAPVCQSAARHLDLALKRFAAQASTTPSAARFLYGRDHIAGEGGGPAAHWRALIAGRIDRSFAETAMRTGQRHARIGVDPRWQAGSHSIIAQALVGGMIRDGVAALMKPRRGPLGLLGSPDPSAVQDATDALAKGVATLVGAVLLDLDLTFAGHMERHRVDAEARLGAQETRLRQALEAAGKMLALAAEGQRDEPLLSADDPDLAPLRAGVEMLANRVVGLLDDLELAGQAAQTLASDVLAGGRALVAGGTAQVEQAQRLAEQLGPHGPRAASVPRGLGELVRHGKARLRRCGKFRRQLALPAADEGQSAALIERVDALGLAANLLSARLKQGQTGGGSVDVDLRALASGLAQVSAQLRADTDRRDSDARRAVAEGARAAGFVAQLVAEMESDLGALIGLERESAALAEGTATLGALAAGLIETAEQGAARLRELQQALAGAEALAEFKQLFDAPATVAIEADERPLHPALDYEAIAAHWHAV